VVPTAARQGEGLSLLTQTVADVIGGKIKTTLHHITVNEALQHAVDELVPMLEALILVFPTLVGWRCACLIGMIKYDNHSRATNWCD